jgi:hypothetical protein
MLSRPYCRKRVSAGSSHSSLKIEIYFRLPPVTEDTSTVQWERCTPRPNCTEWYARARETKQRKNNINRQLHPMIEVSINSALQINFGRSHDLEYSALPRQ